MMEGKKILQQQFLKFLGALLLVVSYNISSGLAQNSNGLLVGLDETKSEHLQDANASSQKLMKIIKLQGGQMQLKAALENIASQAGLELSYSEQLIPLEKKINVKEAEITVKAALWKVLEGTGYRFGISPSGQLFFMERHEKKRSTVMETVEGVVTDAESGDVLPGVNISVKGTTRGTSSNGQGQYSLTVPSLNDTLMFSFIGYETTEVPINGRTNIDVTMQSQAIEGEELVVVGYGEKRKETLTGSIASTSGEDIEKAPVTNVTKTLQGQIPGIIAPSRTGEPGRDDSEILIRGKSTFGNSNPLIVVDGVPRPNADLGRIDPKAIANITVLKDASAAIYGARAANGVILVETKQGVLGDPEFNFTFNQSYTRPTRMMDVMNGYEWAQINNESRVLDGFDPTYSEQELQEFADGDPLDGYASTDWVEETVKPWAPQNKMNLSVSAGSESVRYFLLFGMQNQDGHFKNNPTHYRQFNMRANVDAYITDNLTVGLKASGRIEDRTYPSTGTWVNMLNILDANPTLVARWPNGSIAPGRLEENPLLRDRVGTDNQTSYPIRTGLNIKYEPTFISGLSFNGSYNYDMTFDFNKTIQRPYTYTDYDVQTGEYMEQQSRFYSSLSVEDYFNRYRSSTYNLRANYQKQLASHNFDLMLGAERTETKSNYLEAFRKNFPTSSLTDLNFGSSAPEDQANSGSSSMFRRDNYFGRLSYNFDERYLAEVQFRYDGSPIFPEGKRYGFFPGGSIGWRISEEAFMQDVDFLDDLKLRASYGELGNDNVSNEYAYLSTYYIGYGYNIGGTDVLGLQPGVLPNSNYTWEVLKSANIGLDASLWDDQLGITFDLFKQDRSSILAQRNLSISNTFGFPGLPPENIGKVENKGFELVLSHRDTRGDFSYNVRGNVSYAKNKYVFFDEVPEAEAYQNQTGHPIGAPLVWPTDGIWRSQEEIDQAIADGRPFKDGEPAEPGDVRYVDKNGDGAINLDDQYRLDKSSTPEYVFGLNLSVAYKNFTLTSFFQGAANSAYFPGITDLGGGGNFAKVRAEDRWTPDNRDGSMPKAGADFEQFSEMNMYDNPWVRLKTLELSYNVPNRLLSRLNVDNLRLYLSGYNLFTISELKGLDPEGRGDGSDPNSTRTDANYYPQLTSVNAGIEVTF
ncbi:TonB-dependent receptor [Aliifodinibius sp. S!AR15-10]|uniref:SusC/RagA family TonB-linked outer membrane protein n=1 Tax=Aliifodinibius sp. S!AR15-10 TaxID=2950437 RepID=UPI00285D791E|nr:TonB-dependent receptor [Aliifodinibius sp. S!AR15-10]MDR8393344.1 TonB-dependent receptor [Aliifodinibius sp. S!AR15-10]